MKKKLFLFLMAGLLIASCSKHENLEANLPETDTRAVDANPLIITSPTELYFDAVIIEAVADSVNVKIAGLPSVGLLTSINVTVQGPDAHKFLPLTPDLSLSDMLGLLLGNGLDISVLFLANGQTGEFEAELLIETSLLGILLPMQTIVPLHASYNPAPVELVSTSPTEGQPITFVEDDPDTDGEQGYYYITFTFNQPVSFIGPLQKNGTQQLVENIDNDNTVTLKFRDFKYGSPGFLTLINLPAGSVVSTRSGHSNDEDIYYGYRVIAN